jgi:hypothetical protein
MIRSSFATLLVLARLCSLGAFGCSVAEAQSVAAPAAIRAAGAGDSVAQSVGERSGDAGQDEVAPPVEPSKKAPRPRGATEDRADDGTVGLTRQQVQDRLGAPTEKHGNRWIYRYPAGCSDFVTIEELKFKNGRVAKVRTERRRTSAHCGIDPAFR